MAKYQFNFAELKVGDKFSNFTELFLKLTGEKPPTGKKNRDAVERELSRYIAYEKLCDIDPKEKSKRALIITTIYDTPITLPENRGRNGRYANLLKPMILSKGEFHGTYSLFYNECGVFKKYYVSYYKDMAEQIPRDSTAFNLWRIDDEEEFPPGKREYMRKIFYVQRNSLKTALNSLQKEELLTWGTYHMILPNITVDIEGSSYRKLLTNEEIQERRRFRDEFLDNIYLDKNCILEHETVIILNIYSMFWGGEISWSEYEKLYYVEEQKVTPIRATKAQEKAISNLEQFMRQYTYQYYCEKEHLPPIEDIPNEYDFFNDIGLCSLYKKLVKDMYPWLIGCSSIWGEIEYTVTGTDEQINRYLDTDNFDMEDSSSKLSCEFIKYMDEHMDKLEFLSPPKYQSDLKGIALTSNRLVKQPLPYPLSRSKSACELHKQLKSLYL